MTHYPSQVSNLPLWDVCKNNHGGNEQSEQAHESITPDKQRQAVLVLLAIQATGDAGATCDEVEVTTGLSHQACSARFTELKMRGAIKQTGTRTTRSGRNAGVFIA